MKSCNHRKSYEMIRNHKKSYEIKGNHRQTDMCYLIGPSVGDPWVIPDSAMVLMLSSDDPCRFSNASCVVLERFLCDLGVAMGPRVELGLSVGVGYIWRDNLGIR